MLNVLIDMPLNDPLLSVLRNMDGINVKIVPTPEEMLRSLPDDLIKDCDILFCTIPPENHLQMKKLKLIQISSTGFAQVVGKEFEERGISVCNSLGVFDIPIAEWNIAMMINLTRNLRTMMHNQDSQIWDRSSKFQSEIRGSVVGIWGYGGIGRETTRMAKALGMKVHVLNRTIPGERVNTYGTLGTGDVNATLPDKVFLMNEKRDFLSGIDFLIMAIPQTSSTINIIGEEELKMLRPHVFLLNPARGPLINEEALVKALKEGWIAGAALDTHYYYPMPKDHPFWNMQNVILTPHISGSSGSNRFLERVWDILIENVKRIKNKDPLLNLLTPQQLKGNS